MASLSLPSTLTTKYTPLSSIPSANLFPIRDLLLPTTKRNPKGLSLRAQTLDFSGSFFDGAGFGVGGDDDPPTTGLGSGLAVEDKEEIQCPPGLRQYETMAVLRPDMSEDERLTLTQKYEEVLFFYIFYLFLEYFYFGSSMISRGVCVLVCVCVYVI